MHIPQDTELILGNANKRFSGVTSTMLQVLQQQKKLCCVAVLGKHHLEANTLTLSFWQLLRLARKPLPNGRYRVFHARRNFEMIQALIAKRLFGAKLKIAFTSTAQRHHSRFSRWLMQQMDGIISTCSAAAAFLEHRPPDIIIPHGIDAARYAPVHSKQSAWQALGLAGKQGVGIFGRVRQSKGVDIFVEAAIGLAADYPDISFIICGECLHKDIAFQQALQNKIAEANLSDRFIFLGKQPFDDLPKLFSAMSVVCALSRNEGFGLTPLEAMASGSAVLCSEAGAWPDIVQTGVNGYRVPIGNAAATQAQLTAMLADQTATLQMGNNGRSLVMQHYTVEQEATALTRYLLSLADNSST
jgi:mannosyltransferase